MEYKIFTLLENNTVGSLRKFTALAWSTEVTQSVGLKIDFIANVNHDRWLLGTEIIEEGDVFMDMERTPLKVQSFKKFRSHPGEFKWETILDILTKA
jgi:hypothetical protein